MRLPKYRNNPKNAYASHREAKQASATRESEIQTAIMNALTWHPKVGWAIVTTSGRLRGRGGHWFTTGKVGLPDIIGQFKAIYGGILFGIEVKQPGKRPTKAQEKFLDMILANGGVAGFCDSVESALEILGDPVKGGCVRVEVF